MVRMQSNRNMISVVVRSAGARHTRGGRLGPPRRRGARRRFQSDGGRLACTSCRQGGVLPIFFGRNRKSNRYFPVFFLQTGINRGVRCSPLDCAFDSRAPTARESQRGSDPLAPPTTSNSGDGAARRRADVRVPDLLRLVAAPRPHPQSASPSSSGGGGGRGRGRGLVGVPRSAASASAPHGGARGRGRGGAERRAQRAGGGRARHLRWGGAVPRPGERSVFFFSARFPRRS